MSAVNKCLLMLRGAELLRDFTVGTHAGPEPQLNASVQFEV